MTLEEAFAVLGCEAEASLDMVMQQYQAQYNEMQVRLDNAPTPQLRHLYQDRLHDLEGAYQTLKSLPRLTAVAVEVPSSPSVSPSSPPPPPRRAWGPWGIGVVLALIVGGVVWAVMQEQADRQRRGLEEELQRLKAGQPTAVSQEVTRLQQEVSGQEQTIQSLRGQLEQQQAELAHKQREVESQQREVRQKEQTIADQQQDLDRFQAGPPKTWRSSTTDMEFVLIPAGEFMMGSNDGNSVEKPVHKVRISKPFYLGKYEVTQGQWQAVMGSNPSRFAGDTALPVERVDWGDVQEFIRRLNERERGTAFYRLPTEAEWEYAARAGSTTAYSFGNNASNLRRYAWYGHNAGGKTHPVGQLQPNAWGLYDMYGNVSEWLQDWYGSYASGTAVDPAGPAEGGMKVGRGGDWSDGAGSCQSVSRSAWLGGPYGHLGFRLLRMAE